MQHAKLFALALAAGAVSVYLYNARDDMLRETPLLLPIAFIHDDHVHTPCGTCHHNYFDDTGTDSCYVCHKWDQSVAREIETMFHDFCRGCHLDQKLAGIRSGPTRECAGCHVELENEHNLAQVAK
ncbi:MAG: cytochrome c3 family protein [Pseudomonadota bacterium]